MTRQRAMSVQRGGGFTLLEIAVVVTIMGLIAVSALPAFSALQKSREGAATREVERLLVMARANAMTTGDMTGLAINAGAVASTLAQKEYSIRLVTVNSAGAVEELRDPLGQPYGKVQLEVLFPGVEMSKFINGNGTTGVGTIWFNHDGEPMVKTPAGYEAFTNDAQVAMSGLQTVWVRRISGMVERLPTKVPRALPGARPIPAQPF